MPQCRVMARVCPSVLMFGFSVDGRAVRSGVLHFRFAVQEKEAVIPLYVSAAGAVSAPTRNTFSVSSVALMVAYRDFVHCEPVGGAAPASTVVSDETITALQVCTALVHMRTC
jgi:hypothetical protein